MREAVEQLDRMIKAIESEVGDYVEVSWDRMFANQPFDYRLLDLKCLKHTKQLLIDEG